MRYFILMLLFSFFVVCKEDDGIDFHVQDDPSISTINGTWRVIAYNEFDTKKVIEKDSTNSWGLDVIITFDDSGDPAKVSGSVTTNRVMGSFKYINDRSFKTNGLASTFVAQPEWADRFVDLFSESDLRFEVNQKRLRIFNDQKQLSALLEKE